jgi:hypothetical protein
VRRWVRWAIAAGLLVAAGGRAQPPTSVTLRPAPCGGPEGLRRALELELAPIDLVEEDAPALLVLEGGCRVGEAVVATLVRVATGRSVREPLGTVDAVEPARVLALALAELLRARWDTLAARPPPPSPTPVDDGEGEALRAEIAALRVEVEALRAAPPAAAPSPPPPPPLRRPGTLLDAELAAVLHAELATAALRLGAEGRVADPLRVAGGVLVDAGLTGDALGEVVLLGVGAWLAVRLVHFEGDWVVSGGLRVDLAYRYAEGITLRGDCVDRGCDGSGEQALAAAVLEGRLRVPLAPRLYLSLGLEVGATVLGAVLLVDEGRETERTLLREVGPRGGATVGLSVAL